ncbi:MAG: UDP-N-acetylmuramoylalanine--D-glutamate ligase [Actinobacteria bacterium 13_1_20CM_3_68_9]|nr:MAG: UDP-N-acetylmuramoylalanine--D-glutamate ligase [Actinobacteria bacterium 13_1_20CM_3_68_9]
MPKPRPPLQNGPYLIVGLARSGQAAARLLAQRGEVVGCDSAAPGGAAELAEDGVEVHLGTDGVALLAGSRCLVKSPGVPREAPVVAAATKRGIPVVGELEMAWRLLQNRFVAVTGTNGKTTVTELLGHLWRTAGKPVAVAGNVGTPLASLVDEVLADATVICECSSFQLEDADAFAPECAVLLNATPDHLDRHADFDHYLLAKLRIFANQGNDDVAVFNGSEPALHGLDLGGCARRVAYCRGSDPNCHLSLNEGVIFAGDDPLLEVGDLRVVGAHNADNAMAAAAAALAMGLQPDAVREGLRTFGGIPHRLERVAELRGVLYVNDSKATNIGAATAALRSFEGGVRAILGGSLKGGDFKGLVEPVGERCVACYLIGEAAGQLERDLKRAREAGVELRRCDGLAAAVGAAAADARPGEVVLLAPGCASFDAYRDFEERGEHFRALVEDLDT